MRNKLLRTLSATVVAMLVMLSCMITVFATTGSIKVTVEYEGTLLTDGVLTLYRVADINADGSYTYTSDFAGYGVPITDTEDTTLPYLLWQWATLTGVSGTSYAVGGDGTVTFSGLTEGVYLFAPTVNPDGYRLEASLIPIPLNGEYDIEFTPKIETWQDPDTPTPLSYDPDDPDGPGDPYEVEETIEIEEESEEGDTDEEIELDESEPEPEEEEETLPKTGQLNYPIPIMAGAGACCVAAGLIMTKTDKKK